MNKAAHRLLLWPWCATCASAASATTIIARAQEPGTRDGFRDVPIWVQDGESKDIDTRLGLDVLRSRRLWMPCGTNQVFIQAAAGGL